LRLNQSLRTLDRGDVIPSLNDRLQYLCSEDFRVFETVTDLLDARDAVSITGHDLA
jgi:hypothetical protein